MFCFDFLNLDFFQRGSIVIFRKFKWVLEKDQNSERKAERINSDTSEWVEYTKATEKCG